MARPTICGGCDAEWTSLRLAHCSKCHTSFGSVTPFDRHQTMDDGGVHCHAPADRGLEPRDRAGMTVWVTPMRKGDRWFSDDADQPDDDDS